MNTERLSRVPIRDLLCGVGGLVRQQFTAVIDAAIQNDRSEVRTFFPFGLGPTRKTRCNATHHHAHNIQDLVVKADDANVTFVLTATRAEPDKLNETMKLVAAQFAPGSASDVPNLPRDLFVAVRSYYRATIGNEELKE